MTRYAPGHAAATRERLLDLAAAAIRRDGVAALSVAPLMRAAGLTHGGFYQHFASRNALVAAAIARMFATASIGAADDPAVEPRRRLARFIKAYLSPQHVAAPETGCPLPALAGEGARLAGDAASGYRDGVAALIARVEAMLRDAGDATPETTASSVLAELVGAVTLARLAPDEAKRDHILTASRAALTERLGLGRPAHI